MATKATAALAARELAPLQYFLYTLPSLVVYVFVVSSHVLAIPAKVAG